MSCSVTLDYIKRMSVMCLLVNIVDFFLPMVPKILTAYQKGILMTRAGEFIDMNDADPVLFVIIITGDKIWCSLYDSQTKHQSSE